MVAAVCPHCGYDFPEIREESPRSVGISSITGIASTAGSLFAGICVMVGIFLSLYALVFGEFIKCMVFAVITGAAYVCFQRALGHGRRP